MELVADLKRAADTIRSGLIGELSAEDREALANAIEASTLAFDDGTAAAAPPADGSREVG